MKALCITCGAALTKRNTAIGAAKKKKTCKPCRQREREAWWRDHPEELRAMALDRALEAELLPFQPKKAQPTKRRHGKYTGRNHSKARHLATLVRFARRTDHLA